MNTALFPLEPRTLMAGLVIQCSYPDWNETNHNQFYFHSDSFAPAHEDAIAWMAEDAKTACDRNGGNFSFTLNDAPCKVSGDYQIICKA